MHGTGLLVLCWIGQWDYFEGLSGVVALMIDGYCFSNVDGQILELLTVIKWKFSPTVSENIYFCIN